MYERVEEKMKEILREIGSITRCFESIANIEYKEYHLAKNQYLYLTRICEQPGIILERLCDNIKVDRSTGSRACDKLAAADFICKKKVPGNGKNIGLYPTEKGLNLYEFMNTEELYSDKTALQGFTDEEINQLYEWLVRIRKNIEPDWELVKKGGKRQFYAAGAAEIIQQTGNPMNRRETE